jgi:hypothetical protein
MLYCVISKDKNFVPAGIRLKKPITGWFLGIILSPLFNTYQVIATLKGNYMKLMSVIPMALLVMLPLASNAADKACLIEGKFSFMGQTIHSKDCVQSDPKESEAAFKGSCEALANMSVQMGGEAGKIDYMEQCPLPAQGICKGMMGTKRDAYYYARSADDLATLPAGCNQFGGSWRNAD